MEMKLAFATSVTLGKRSTALPLTHVRHLACARRPRGRAAAYVPVQACASSVRGKTLPVTTPLYYANAPPHAGSAYPTMAADTYARFLRLAGANPVFVTGTDEHGEKIAQSANAANDGDSPLSLDKIQEFCDGIVGSYKELWEELDIRYDRFSRTTSEQHKAIVGEFMERVWEKGDIYKDVYNGLYCTACEEYKDPKDLIDGDVCPIHLKACEDRNEENYFFALSKYQTQLEEFHRDNPDFVQPSQRRNEVLGWIQEGVHDFSVTRANNPWGIPVPRDESHTIYVWFDALLGYISCLLEDGDDVTLEAALARGWPAHTHIIGKDILRFHAIYWPGMLMSAGLPLPKKIIGHGFLTKDGLKMGKSLGNTLDPLELVSTYGSDAVRYYFMKGVDFGRDGDFSEQRFVNLVNNDLANSFGNAVSRSINLLVKNCDGVLPLPSSDIGRDDAEKRILDVSNTAATEAFEKYLAMDFVGACESVMSICTAANSYIDTVAPWTAFKSDDKEDREEAERCIVTMLEVTRLVAVGLSPVTPKLSHRVYVALGLGEEFSGLDWEMGMSWGRLESGMAMEKPKPLFPRLEAPKPAGVAVGAGSSRKSRKGSK